VLEDNACVDVWLGLDCHGMAAEVDGAEGVTVVVTVADEERRLVVGIVIRCALDFSRRRAPL